MVSMPKTSSFALPSFYSYSQLIILGYARVYNASRCLQQILYTDTIQVSEEKKEVKRPFQGSLQIVYVCYIWGYILLHCSAHNTTTLRVALVAGSAEVPHGPIFWHSDDSIVSSGWKLCPETPERP